MNDDFDKKLSLGVIAIIGLAIAMGVVGFAFALFAILH